MDRAVNAGGCLCPGGYAAGIGFALFYGFCGVIATGHGWTALYPPTAGTVLLRFRMDPTPRELACAALSLLASLGLAVALAASSIVRKKGSCKTRSQAAGCSMA